MHLGKRCLMKKGEEEQKALKTDKINVTTGKKKISTKVTKLPSSKKKEKNPS